MLAQHIITQPVFEALFDSYAFTANNPVSKAMNKIVALLNDKIDESDRKSLESFYNSVRRRAEGIDNAEAKQKIVVELYDKFFTTAFPKVKEQLGIVYTPVEVVDFIIHSVEHVLREQFGRSLNDRKVKIIDPFTGTGTFITRLLQSGIIKDIEYKYKNEIFANEIVLLAYYIASVNIENVYHDLLQKTDSYTAFPGICLTDTFQLGEQMYARERDKKYGKQSDADVVDSPFVENSKRVQRQLDTPITVIIGNPPYSIGQKSANDNNQNEHYPLLEKKIQDTYVVLSEAHTKNAMFDSYIKAFRYSADRLGDEGIIAFVSNGSWLDTNAADGFRKSIEKEFAQIYVFNLRGNQRTSGELSRREGGKIFGSGSRTPVSITLLVKKPHRDKAVVHYHDIGDYLSREQKLDIIRKAHSIATLPMDILHPNQHGDWINHRNDSFIGYITLGDKEDPGNKATFFKSIYARGLGTSRDIWVYNSSNGQLTNTISGMIDFYNIQREKINRGEVKDVEYDVTQISWNAALLKDISKNLVSSINDGYLTTGAYRPFCKQNLYFNPQWLNESVGAMQRYLPKGHKNLIIGVSCAGSAKGLSLLIVDTIPDLHMVGDTQCFPLYWYEKRTGTQGNLFDDGNDEYVRHDAITDYILKRAREQYGNKVTKEDIFYYVYGFLHCPSYRETFANDLKKMLPRLPLVEKADDFWAFSQAGRKLAELHLNYEQIEASKEVVVDWNNILPGIMDAENQEQLYRVNQMRFGKRGKEKDKSVIEYNSYITLRNIPLRAYNYVVNGKSAIEWIMERYCDKTDAKSGIRNDANQWGIEHGNPKYPLELLQSIITLSLKTLDIVDNLPKLKFE
jgi:predicted helicase